MSHAAHIALAIVFIPARHPLDGCFARQCDAHFRRRSYGTAPFIRDWKLVETLLDARIVNTVVMPPGVYWAAGPDAREVSGESTQVLPRSLPIKRPRSNQRGDGPRAYGTGESLRSRVRDVVDGTAPPDLQRTVNESPALIAEVTAYKTGYQDGYVDCATIRRTEDE